MNLCYFCKYNLFNGKGCMHKELSNFLGNKFPSGIRINYCQRFTLFEDKHADMKLSVGPNHVKVYYKFNFKKKF